MSRRNTGFSDEVRQLVTTRASALCERCGEYHSITHLHHRLPRKAGGTKRKLVNLPSNGLLLCALCHHDIEMHRTEAYVNGWLVHDYPESEPPCEREVLRRGVWVRLDNQGGFELVPAPQGGTAA